MIQVFIPDYGPYSSESFCHPAESNHSIWRYHFGTAEVSKRKFRQPLIINCFNSLPKTIPERTSNNKKLFCTPIVKISVRSVGVLQRHVLTLFLKVIDTWLLYLFMHLVYCLGNRSFLLISEERSSVCMPCLQRKKISKYIPVGLIQK